VFGGSSPQEILLVEMLSAEHKSTINRLDAADPAWDGPKVGEGGSNGDAAGDANISAPKCTFET
jgi:hypothetical protein